MFVSAVPTGLGVFFNAYPALKGWAKLFCPAGRDWCAGDRALTWHYRTFTANFVGFRVLHSSFCYLGGSSHIRRAFPFWDIFTILNQEPCNAFWPNCVYSCGPVVDGRGVAKALRITGKRRCRG